MKTIIFSGEIGEGFEAWGRFSTLLLKQADGYRIDLVARLNEAVLNYGRKVNVRYWIAAARQSKEAMQKGAMMRVFGKIEVEHDAQEYCYSEYTSGCDYETIVNVDKHNLYYELLGHRGRFLWLEVDFYIPAASSLPECPQEETI